MVNIMVFTWATQRREGKTNAVKKKEADTDVNASAFGSGKKTLTHDQISGANVLDLERR